MKLDIVEDGKLIPYRRLGKCRQCGACCHKKITFLWGIQKPGSEKGKGTWDEWEGASIIYARGIYWYILVTKVEDPEPDDERNPCTSLEGNLCSIHEDQFKIPPLCPLWPVHPKDLLPGCGYSFRRERTQEEFDALLISKAKAVLDISEVPGLKEGNNDSVRRTQTILE